MMNRTILMSTLKLYETITARNHGIPFQCRGFKSIFFALWCCLPFLQGCGSAEVVYDRYSLIGDLDAQAFVTDNLKVRLLGVLGEGGVVLETSDVTLRPAKNHRWADDLALQLELITSQQLTAAGISPLRSFEITVFKFQGDLKGEVTIAAVCREILSDKRKKPAVYEMNYREHQQQDGYQALVETLRQGWLQLSQELAVKLSRK